MHKYTSYILIIVFTLIFLPFTSYGEVNNSSGFVASCDIIASVHKCYDFRGNGWVGKEDAKFICDMHKGTYSDSACPQNDDTIGSCTDSPKKRRNEKEMIFVFYKPILEEHARMGCKDNFVPKK